MTKYRVTLDGKKQFVDARNPLLAMDKAVEQAYGPDAYPGPPCADTPNLDTRRTCWILKHGTAKGADSAEVLAGPVKIEVREVRVRTIRMRL